MIEVCLGVFGSWSEVHLRGWQTAAPLEASSPVSTYWRNFSTTASTVYGIASSKHIEAALLGLLICEHHKMQKLLI